MELGQSVPLVSCAMITIDRADFVRQAIAYFDAQQYPNRELVIVDDGAQSVASLCQGRDDIRYVRCERPLALGAKRNIACREASGDLIVHWDDDDWHAPWRLNNQVRALADPQHQLCGLNRLVYFDPVANQAWLYRYASVGGHPWMSGGTFCFRREWWEASPFEEEHFSGEDNAFFSQLAPAQVVPVEDESIFVALLHAGNIRRSAPKPPAWTPYAVERVRERMGLSAVSTAKKNCQNIIAPPLLAAED